MVRHAKNRPDHHELLDAAQTTLDRKRKLADLKRELAAEKSRKIDLSTETGGGNSAASALLADDTAPTAAAAAAANSSQPLATAAGPQEPATGTMDSVANHVRFQMKDIPGFDFMITVVPSEAPVPP